MRGAQRPPLARSRVVPPAFTDGVELSLAVADPAAPSTSAQPSPASSASGGWAKADAEAPAAAHSSNGSDNRNSGGGGGGEAGQAAHGAAIIPAAPVAAQGGGAAAAEGLDAQLQRLRLAAQESDGILQSLAVKYGCSDGGGANAGGRPDGSGGGGGGGSGAGEDDDYAEVPAPGRPLSWFGSLVAPSLREAEAQFSDALSAAVAAANAQRHVRAGADGLRGSVGGGA
ncbi:hypothetical protein C2E20_8790 [Micractinium conductrix]|uniref:Uncharacterized protein n=1 Tax=Micractinium conductrix TaxID=554055 RepID=A0A2P6V0E6_9CHLO|nr:hypothetical protein C2E20_8790 [Micractinium conductrix]|eukprot:PSC67559.1 hypothetical protein C2E20_8790 [Micractinium conductrix]